MSTERNKKASVRCGKILRGSFLFSIICSEIVKRVVFSKKVLVFLREYFHETDYNKAKVKGPYHYL